MYEGNTRPIVYGAPYLKSARAAGSISLVVARPPTHRIVAETVPSKPLHTALVIARSPRAHSDHARCRRGRVGIGGASDAPAGLWDPAVAAGSDPEPSAPVTLAKDRR